MPNRQFPIHPRSNRFIVPGDYWPILLVDGTIAVGRVIELPSKGGIGSRSSFLAGLMDWRGENPPVPDELAGSQVLEQGVMGIAAFKFNSWSIIGNRPLDLDDLHPWLFRETQLGPVYVSKGLGPARSITVSGANQLPVLTSWGMSVIEILAEMHFLGSHH